MSLRTSNFNQDSKNEDALGSFLDDYFYSRMPWRKYDPNLSWTEDSRKSFKNNEDLQYSGVDVQLAQWVGKSIINIDEKAALDYCNRNLPTGAFELSSRNKNGAVVEGWFLKPGSQNITDYYLYAWPNTIYIGQGQFLPPTEPDNFSNVEVMLISKMLLHQYLEQQHLSFQVLQATATKIRGDYQYAQRAYSHNHSSPFWFSLTSKDKKIEEPINLVVRKSVLNQLAILDYQVSANGIKIYKEPQEQVIL